MYTLEHTHHPPLSHRLRHLLETVALTNHWRRSSIYKKMAVLYLAAIKVPESDLRGIVGWKDALIEIWSLELHH